MSIDATRFVWKLTKTLVTPIEKLLLLSIADRCGETGECWPSIARLTKDTGLSKDAIIRHRNKLIKQGILRYTGHMVGSKKQIPVMQLMIDDYREGIISEDKVNRSFPATGSQEIPVPVAGKDPYRSFPATQNLKDEPKLEPISVCKEETHKTPHVLDSSKQLKPIEYPDTYYENSKELKEKKEDGLIIQEMLNTNPFSFSELAIYAWFSNQKKKNKPITSGTWAMLLNDCYKYQEAGLNPQEEFEVMVKMGWDCLNLRKALKHKQDTKGSDNNSTGYLNSGILNRGGKL